MSGKQKKGLVAFVAVIVVAIAAIGAYAYWTNGGSGSGTAAAGTTADNVVITASGWLGIKPGDTVANASAKTVSVNLDNSANAFGSYVKNVVLDTAMGTNGIDTSNALCVPGDFVFTSNSSVTGNVNATLPPSSATNAVASVGTLGFTDTALNQDACKAPNTITVYLKIDNS